MRGTTTVCLSRVSAVVAAALVLCLGRGAGAQLANVSVSGSPGVMRVRGAVAGAVSAPVVDATTTYTFYNIGGTNSKKITAQLNAPMPSGVTLRATFDAPTNAVSIPDVSLDATARDVVTGLDFSLGTTKAITYTLSAALSAGVVSQQSRTVTLTIIAAP